MYFTISDSLDWQINFKAGEQTLTTKLNLNESEQESKRLLLCLYAGDEQGAGVYVAFGTKMGFLEFKPAMAKKS